MSIISNYIQGVPPSRPSALIESSSRVNPSGDNANNCRVAFPFDIKGIWSLREANIYWVNYNITPNNNTFSFTSNAITYSNLSVPIGSYTQDTLLTAMAAAMTGLGAGTYTASTGPSKITGSALAYTILFGTRLGTTFAANPFSTLASVVGFPNTDVASTALVVTPALTPQLNWMLALHFDFGIDRPVRLSASRGATFTVPISNTATGVLYYQPNQANQEANFTTAQSQVEVKVTDSSGGLAYLPQGWQLHIELVRG